MAFDPLTLCSSIAPLLQTLSSDESSYTLYHGLLQRALLSRLLSQLSQVYSSIKISTLLEVVAPLRNAGLEGAYDEEQVEAYVMGCARRGELNIRVDHKAGSITFVDEAFLNADDPRAVVGTRIGTVSERVIQPSVSEIVKTRLNKLSLCLHNSLVMLQRTEAERTATTEREGEEQQSKFKALVAAAEVERKALQLRRALVIRRKELMTELSARKEKEESSRKAEIIRREKEEEERRVKEDFRRKELERLKKVNDSIRVGEAKKLAQQLMDRGVLKKKVTDEVGDRILSSCLNSKLISLLQDMETLNTDKLMIIQVEQLEKEKKDLNERLRITAKRVDHIERAYRKEERPLLAKDYEDQKENDRITFNAIQQGRLDASKLAYDQDIAAKRRLSRMMGDYLARKEAQLAKKKDDFAKKTEAALKKMEDEKAKRRRIVLQEREEKRRQIEEEERKQRELEEEQARLEAGTWLPENRRSLLNGILKSALLQKSDNVRRKRPHWLLPKPRNERRRKSKPHCASSVKTNVPLLPNLPDCNANERMRLRRVHKHEQLRRPQNA